MARTSHTVPAPVASLVSGHNEDFILIWLDKENRNNAISVALLRPVINDILTYTSSNDCYDYISKVKDERIFFIVSDSLGQEIIPHIHNFLQINSIYLFSAEKECQGQWAKAFRKVKGIYRRMDELCKQLREDTHLSEQHLSLRFNIAGNVALAGNHQNKQEASFMYGELLQDTLMMLNDGDEHQLAEFCRPHYDGNTSEMRNIDELESTYDQYSPVWWYTRHTFVYKMLNKALRDQHIETLYAFRQFMSDLFEELHKLCKNSVDQGSITLYRGQAMPNEQFEQLKTNEGGLLSIGSFLSTSSDVNVGLAFTGGYDGTTPVLMVIEVDLSLRGSRAYADIDHLSNFAGQENEWLFSPGSAFRIRRVERNNQSDGIWYVHLTLTNQCDVQLRELMMHISVSIENRNQMGQWKAAERFSLIALKVEHGRMGCAKLLQKLGWIYQEQNELDQALEYFQQSVRIWQEHDSGGCLALSQIYINIGSVFWLRKDLDVALEYHHRALSMGPLSNTFAKETIANAYNNIGVVLEFQGKYAEALEYKMKTRDIWIEILPSTHPALGTSYHNIAHSLFKLGRLAEAMDYQEKAVKIDIQSLPANHSQVKEHKEGLAFLQERMHQ